LKPINFNSLPAANLIDKVGPLCGSAQIHNAAHTYVYVCTSSIRTVGRKGTWSCQ